MMTDNAHISLSDADADTYPQSIPFLKMNGLGNDFVVIDARQLTHKGAPFKMTPTLAAAIGNREHGIGCDQLIVILPATHGGAAFMGIWNTDGSRAEACGNATRCVGDLLLQETQDDAVMIETIAGDLIAAAAPGAMITVDMGEPRLEWDQIPLAEEIHDTRGIELQIGPIDAPILHTPAVVNVGNPHAIFFVDDIEDYNLEQVGPLLENHPMFPERANISLAQILAPDHIRLKVWERGVGLTLACGTAACATIVAAVRKNLSDRQARVSLPGGDLYMAWNEDDNHIYMTGPTSLDYEGSISPQELLARNQ